MPRFAKLWAVGCREVWTGRVLTDFPMNNKFGQERAISLQRTKKGAGGSTTAQSPPVH